MSQLSNEVQMQYIIKWFQEFSEMQREDFLVVLLEQNNAGEVNGIVSAMDNLNADEVEKKPPSLFQCRIKLFREWSQNWTQSERESVLTSIKNLDPAFREKYEERLSEG